LEKNGRGISHGGGVCFEIPRKDLYRGGGTDGVNVRGKKKKSRGKNSVTIHFKGDGKGEWTGQWKRKRTARKKERKNPNPTSGEDGGTQNGAPGVLEKRMEGEISL